jgi:tRNA1Val (adenine37-N6)-methyltransferase
MTRTNQRRQRNTHFTFKQFRIDQRDCAMKVSSDGCLFGAWINPNGARRVLDIGTGSGLLALMLAQRAAPETRIDAVEISPQAARMARQNVAGSPFATMIHVYEEPIQQFQPEDAQRYDLIVANPPFFLDALLGKNKARNLARHALEDGLDFIAMLQAVMRLLADDGTFWLLLPPIELQKFSDLASTYGLHELQRVAVSHKPGDPINRLISAFSRSIGPLQTIKLVRCGDDGKTPSPEAHALLVDYMLYY